MTLYDSLSIVPHVRMVGAFASFLDGCGAGTCWQALAAPPEAVCEGGAGNGEGAVGGWDAGSWWKAASGAGDNSQQSAYYEMYSLLHWEYRPIWISTPDLVGLCSLKRGKRELRIGINDWDLRLDTGHSNCNNTLQHTKKHCNTLQILCNTLQRTATHCNRRQDTPIAIGCIVHNHFRAAVSECRTCMYVCRVCCEMKSRPLLLTITTEWLLWVGSIRLLVSFAEYSLFINQIIGLFCRK